jgi:conjugal transfer mating pair stabilization protein TraN
MFAIVVALKMFEAYQAALACDQEDYETATLKKGKLCYSYGSWCERKSSGIFGSTCEVYRTGHCCYNSVLARIINEQGRKQLGLPMDVCNGFTIEQIQALDWNEIDLTEFISIMLEKAQESLPTPSDMERLKSKFSSNAGVSASTGKQPIDQTLEDGTRKPHN